MQLVKTFGTRKHRGGVENGKGRGDMGGEVEGAGGRS